MSILRSGLLRKVVIAGLSLIIVLVSVSVIDKKIHFISKVNQKIGEVAGIFLANKFLDTLIPDTISAQVASPYQDVQGDVIVSGKVGIGTAGSLQQLSITGGLGFANQNAVDKKLYSPADGTLEWMTHSSAIEHGFAVSHQGTKYVYLNISGDSYLNGGKVGIGTPSPGATLDVNGSVKVGGGTVFNKIQAGSINTGSVSGGGWHTFRVNFPSAFSATPHMTASANTTGGVSDFHLVTVKNCSTTGCDVLARREDDSSQGWGAGLDIAWFAWQ